MIRRLPPFGPLVAFDAVARHRSFTRAAADLGVTQSAVSHRVRRLEEHFGAALLLRTSAGVALSDDGARLHGRLSELLEGLSGLEPALRRRPGRQILRLGAGASLAGWWLVRRLPDFHARHPDIEIDFAPVEADSGGDTSLDVRVMWTTLAESRPSTVQTPLFGERVFPVCAPSLLPRGKPLATPAGLLRLPLIRKVRTPSGEWSWTYWFDRLGLEGAPPRGPVLGDIGLCLAAAVEGAGVALGRSLLVADAIADGRLVPALASAPDVPSSKFHVARWRADLIGDRGTRALVAWLKREAEATTRKMAGA